MFFSKRIAIQKGLGLPSAIFVIMVLSIMVLAIQRLNQSNAVAYSQEWLSLKAFYAAESGAQIGATQLIHSREKPDICNKSLVKELTFTQEGLRQCKVNVSCSEQTFSNNRHWTIVSTGKCGLELDQATRVIQLKLTDLSDAALVTNLVQGNSMLLGGEINLGSRFKESDELLTDTPNLVIKADFLRERQTLSHYFVGHDRVIYWREVRY